MSKTRTFEFVITQRVRVVVEQEYLDDHREKFKGTKLQHLSVENPEDEEFGEIILKKAIREFVRDSLQQGFDRTEHLRGRFGPPSCNRIDNRKRSIPDGALPVLAGEVLEAIPT